jgi:hypothetical protein
MIVGALAAAIFLAVAGAGWFTVRELHEYSSKLVVDTLPGLVDSGLAGERMHDNRHTMHDMLFPHTAAERAQMIQLVKTNTTDPLWRDYSASIFEPVDLQNYQAMMLARSNYLQGCDQFLDLVSAGKIDEATVLFNGETSRRFQDYNAAAKNLFDYNMRQGIDRGKIILETATYAPWVIAGVCVLMFGFGLLLGLRLVLSGAKLTRRQPGP